MFEEVLKEQERSYLPPHPEGAMVGEEELRSGAAVKAKAVQGTDGKKIEEEEKMRVVEAVNRDL